MAQRIKNAQAVKIAKTNLSAVATKFKTAQDEGTLSADETKELNIEILEMAAAIGDIAETVVEGVPAEGLEGEEMTVEEPEVVEGDGDGISQRINQGAQDEMKKENLDLKNKMAQLEDDMEETKKEAKQKDLAIQYAQIYPEKLRAAKQKEFATSTDSLPILEARLKEAKSFMTNKSIIKEAALESGSLFEITESDSSQNNLAEAIQIGSKI